MNKFKQPTIKFCTVATHYIYICMTAGIKCRKNSYKNTAKNDKCNERNIQL